MRVIGDRFVIDETVKPRSGGMAEVFRAADSEQGMSLVAIKLFFDGFVDSKLTLEAFSRETKALHELNNHPNIATLIDCGTDNKTQRKYIVLPWFESDLSSYVMEHAPKGWDDFYARYGEPILNALSFAYSRDILHRDVKPQNVLLDDGIVKVADFGISKYRAYYRPGVTLASFSSPPYSPPERDSGLYSDTRDVYGFAVLALECLSDKPLDVTANVPELMVDFDGPPEVVDLLLRAVDIDPEKRQSNIDELKSELDSIQSKRRKAWVSKYPCYMRLTKTAIDKLRVELNEQNPAKIDRAVLDDLNDACSIDFSQSYENGKETASSTHFDLYSAQYIYEVAIDDRDSGRLAVLNIRSSWPAKLAAKLESAFSPQVEFFCAAPPDEDIGAKTLRYIIHGIEEYVTEKRRYDAEKRENALFEKWGNLLRLKIDHEAQRESPIRYDGFTCAGNRATFHTTDVPETEMLGGSRLVNHEGIVVIQGIIEGVTESTVTIYCEAPYLEDAVPKRGSLVFDTRLARIAIQRQFSALDSVRFDRAVRPDIRKILVHPDKVGMPLVASLDFLFQPELDDDKKGALALALGAKDFSVVEGPPGTGKTKFIAELVLQFLKRNPSARILLSSQTHNALDNAIERIRPLAKQHELDLTMVRIAARTSERVSEAVQDLLLENCVDAWLVRVKRNSEKFVESWAKERGINSQEVRFGLAIASLRSSRSEFTRAQSGLHKVDNEIATLAEEEERLRNDNKSGDNLAEVRQKLQESRNEKTHFSSHLEEARRRLRESTKNMREMGTDGESIVGLASDELEQWESIYINSTEYGPNLRKMIELLEEWYDRFGRSRDFHAAFVTDSQVVAATCVAIAGRGLQDIEFDLCIVDEASKATPTEMLVPIARARQWVIVGDTRQLPPFKGDYTSEELKRYDIEHIDLKATLLGYLLERLPASCKALLRTQHRMIRPIGDLISNCFYDGRLNSCNEEETGLERAHALSKPVVWFSTSGRPNCREARIGTSYKNFAEVSVVEALLRRLNLAAKSLDKRLQVAIMSGYLPQLGELKRIVMSIHTQLEWLDVDCETVDAFQGREADVAIYSITRSNDQRNIGFLREYERLNVALSRARHGLAIVGDLQFCEGVVGKNPFLEVINYIRTHPSDCEIKYS